VHPHAFRHLFARRFLGEGGDITLLADLMGHSSVETTRVYLRRTASEQHDEINRIVSW
jgi:site-specific recombinase XerD